MYHFTEVEQKLLEKINDLLDDPEKLASYFRALAELEYYNKMKNWFPTGPMYMYPSPPSPPNPWTEPLPIWNPRVPTTGDPPTSMSEQSSNHSRVQNMQPMV